MYQAMDIFFTNYFICLKFYLPGSGETIIIFDYFDRVQGAFLMVNYFWWIFNTLALYREGYFINVVLNSDGQFFWSTNYFAFHQTNGKERTDFAFSNDFI